MQSETRGSSLWPLRRYQWEHQLELGNRNSLAFASDIGSLVVIGRFRLGHNIWGLVQDLPLAPREDRSGESSATGKLFSVFLFVSDRAYFLRPVYDSGGCADRSPVRVVGRRPRPSRRGQSAPVLCRQ